jgi:CHAD domain-containing protein
LLIISSLELSDCSYLIARLVVQRIRARRYIRSFSIDHEHDELLIDDTDPHRHTDYGTSITPERLAEIQAVLNEAAESYAKAMYGEL